MSSIKISFTYTPDALTTSLSPDTATKNYLASLQNPDGGFKVGGDIDYLLSLFGAYSIFFTDLIN